MGDPLSSGVLPLDDAALQGYIIEREMGGGGMSRLFRARDRQFDRTVVIKILMPSDLDRISIDRFRREITVATSLQHPNIVPILSAGELGTDPRIPFFIMPFVDGESLRDRLLRGPLSVREAVHIARDVARALRHAHERGIVHRDIKPGNVLLSAGAAVVSDFGVAKALLSSRQAARGSGSNPEARRVAQPSLTALGTSLGTPAYMAPEQAAADPNVDHRADIYALGIVLYEMLVGAPPFQGRSPQELLRAQLADPPPPIATRRYDVPALLAELISKCLEKEPGRRPKSAADVLSWLDDPAVVSGAFVNAPSDGGRTFGVKRAHRGAIVSVIAVIGLAALYMSVADSAARTEAAADSAAAARELANRPAAVIGQSRELIIGPLSVVGGDARARSLGEALASELATSLANVPGIRVGAQSSRARGTAASRDSGAGGASASDSATTPAAPMLRLEGTVQRENADFRVLLRAIDTGADSTLWSGSFDGRADSLLALQRRVALEVTFAINNLLSARTSRP